MALKFCPKCGNELESDASFCDACGADLREKRESLENSTPSISKPIQEYQKKAETIVYADFLPRLVAIIIDGIIISIIGWLILLPFEFNPFRMFWQSYLVNYAIGFLYYFLLETYNNGQTLGKAALNLRTVDEKTFKPTTPDKYAINNLLKAGSFLLLIDFIIGILMNSGKPERRLRLMQNASETVVITTK
ncbi:MAG: RDD family protein [Candidatus Thorarchaeota archaeon]